MLMRDYVSEEGGWPYGDIRNYVFFTYLFLHIYFLHIRYFWSNWSNVSSLSINTRSDIFNR